MRGECMQIFFRAEGNLSVWIRRVLEISPEKAMSDEFMQALQRFFDDLWHQAVYGKLESRNL
jgi:hypothetical protein